MLLIVTGPRQADEAGARDVYGRLAAGWPAVVQGRAHPRTGAPLLPAITRLDLFLAAFSPAPEPNESGLPFAVPSPAAWFRWVPALRAPLRALILAGFPPEMRYRSLLEPAGPPLASPGAAADLPHLRSLVGELRQGTDPAQPPADPRLWLVTAPPLPAPLETAVLSSFLRAEPFARLARFEGGPAEAEPWLAKEADRLLAGEGLVTEGLVADLASGAVPAFTEKDEAGNVTASSSLFDLVSALQDLYATREVVGPGEVYNRLHSHSGSEELYIVLEGEGVVRVNERALPIRAGQCFGKPRGYGCATQIANTGTASLVLLDVGTANPAEIDLCHYPEHGELMARFAGHRWLVPAASILPGSELSALYGRRYHRAAGTPAAPAAAPRLSQRMSK